MDGADAKLICNADRKAAGKRTYFGNSADAIKRAKIAAVPIRDGWIQNPSSIPLQAAAFLLQHDDRNQSMLRRNGLLDAVTASLSAPAETPAVDGTSSSMPNDFQAPVAVALKEVPLEPSVADASDVIPDRPSSRTSWTDDSSDSSELDANIVLNSSEVDLEAALEQFESSQGHSPCDTVLKSISFARVLQDWAVSFKVTKAAVTGLLQALHKHKPTLDYSILPLSARQLLKVRQMVTQLYRT